MQLVMTVMAVNKCYLW